MDPDATLAQLRANVALILGSEWPHRTDDAELMLTTLAGDFQALDEWLTRGGFKPRPWRDPYTAHRSLR